jgi:Major tropism determinant N-terminal domain
MALKKIKIRRGTSSDWIGVNPILEIGELGYEMDTGITSGGYRHYKFKVGDGESPWVDLPYIGIGNPSGGGGGGGPVEWADVQNKPSTFAPSAHTHPWADVTGKPATFAPSAHTHPWSEVTSKPTEFTPIAHQHPWTDITDKPTEFPAEQHSHSISEVSGLNASLAAKATVTQLSTAIDQLKDGVAGAGDTLQKLYSLILSSQDQFSVANIAERDALDVLNLNIQVFVVDDGDGNWALYKPTTLGVGASFIKISDPDLLNAVMSAAQIKTSYESNPDTNVYTNAEKSKLASITAIFTTALKTSYDSVVDWLGVNQTDVADAVFKKHTHANQSVIDAITSGVKSGYDSAVTWISTNGSALITHLSRTDNPHSVTKSQVGLSDVDNTADSAKPVSTAQATAIATKQASSAELTAIASITPTNDDFIQRKSGSWTNRTVAQVKSDLGIAGSIQWAGARIRRATNQSIPAAPMGAPVWHDLSFDTAAQEVGGDWWTSGANVTVAVAGQYVLAAEATIDGSGLLSVITGFMQVLVNGSVVGADESQVAINSLESLAVNACRYLNVGDVVKVQVRHSDTTSARNVLAEGDHSPDIWLSLQGGLKGDTGNTGPAGATATQSFRTTSTGITLASSSGNRFYSMMGGASSGTEATVQMYVEYAMTLKQLLIKTTNTQSALGSMVWAVRKNGADTGLLITIAAGATANVFTISQDVSLAIGDLICLRAVNNAAATSANITQYSIIYQG